MVREIRGMGMEVCTTLGMLTPEEAKQLKEAGLTAYNHNLDTSREFYPEVCRSIALAPSFLSFPTSLICLLSSLAFFAGYWLILMSIRLSPRERTMID